VHRFGTAGTRPKVYVQAGIHADELPANLTAHHLRPLLAAAEEDGRITGEIVLVPVANPIGFSHVLNGDHLGRHHMPSGQNYNRGWPNVTERVRQDTAGRLGSDQGANQRFVQAAIGAALEEVRPGNEAEALRLMLMRLAHDADIALDLHTDSEAELHLYLDPDWWPQAQDLAGLLDAKAVMFARATGDNPFEETVAAPYIAAREVNPDRPLPLPFTTVIELRGEADTRDELAARDADALVRFLVKRGVISGDVGEVPAFTGIAGDFSATQVISAPAAGIIVFKAALGDMVAPGDVIAEIVDPLNDGAAGRVPVAAETAGRFFASSSARLAWPGRPIGKIHGDTPLAGRTPGKLLYD